MPTAPPSSPSPLLRVHVALLAVQVSFGGFHVVARGVLEHLSPLALAGIRVALATPLLLLWAWHHDRTLPKARDLPSLALLGLFGVFANQLLFLSGLARTTATNASILMPSIPAFAAGVALLLGVERFRWQRMGGIAMTVLGALVLLDPSRFTSSGGASTLGDLLVLANCLSYATFLVLQRPVLTRIPWRTVIAWAFLFGGLGIVPLGLGAGGAELGALPAAAWWGIAYIVLFPTLFGYATNSWAIHRSSPSLAAAYTTLQPLVTSLLAAIWLGERLGWRQAVGFLAIAAGLLLVSGQRSATPA